MLADELRAALIDAGAIVIGPVGTFEQAVELVRQEHAIDGAVLDVNLGGKMVYPLADLLMSRGTPFIFTTGYDATVIPLRYDHIARCEKPIDISTIAQAIGR